MNRICKLQGQRMRSWRQLNVRLLLAFAVMLVHVIKLDSLAFWEVFAVDVDMVVPTVCMTKELHAMLRALVTAPPRHDFASAHLSSQSGCFTMPSGRLVAWLSLHLTQKPFKLQGKCFQDRT